MEMEDIIREFWRCSLRSDFSEFDWDEAFDTFEPYLARNVIAHGLGTFEEFRDYYDEIYGLNSMECDIPDWAKYETNWGWFSDVDACEALLRGKWEFMRDCFGNNVHGDLADLRDRIGDRRGLGQAELIQLFDECIHAQHATGDILEDVDIEDLRDEAEDEWKEEQEAAQAERDRFPTNIREFLTQD
jgi:hypothetical protein